MLNDKKMNKLKHLFILILLVSTSVHSGEDNIGTEDFTSSNHFAGNYMGINIGHVESNSYSKSLNHGLENHQYSSTGRSSYNITLGKNWMASDSLLTGFELALGYMDLDSSHPGSAISEEDGKNSLHGGAHLDLALRAGLVRGDYMAYIKAGVVKTDINHSFIDTDETGQTIISGTESSSLTGKVYGIGVERRINPTTNFSIAYNRYDFDMASGTATTPITPANGTAPHHHETNIKIISVGLISKF